MSEEDRTRSGIAGRRSAVPEGTHPPLVVTMGVSGSGKTVVGASLARRLRVPFADADDVHPPENITKMSAGVPLTDDDRELWLRTVAQWLHEHASGGGVVACSALKRSYRVLLREHAPHTVFLHLHGDRDVLAARVAARPGHFMPLSLLESQLATLEPLRADEPGATLDVRAGVDDLVEQSVTILAARGRPTA